MDIAHLQGMGSGYIKIGLEMPNPKKVLGYNSM
jgi:hypothetical protein